ncbi:hypothetical protein Syun_019980 [Stephania yunnanensis]|uniref:Uncharacterized protein n=1 Tax=Stephania yunnanensis TaxID=152371 RepID=A0AAP0NX59_9MAGN
MGARWRRISFPSGRISVENENSLLHFPTAVFIHSSCMRLYKYHPTHDINYNLPNITPPSPSNILI